MKELSTPACGGQQFHRRGVKVTIPGDINGDFKVALSDRSILVRAYDIVPARVR